MAIIKKFDQSTNGTQLLEAAKLRFPVIGLLCIPTPLYPLDKLRYSATRSRA